MASQSPTSSQTASRSRKKSYFCPHCKRNLGKTAFFKHKRFFYDHSKRRWSETRLNWTRPNMETGSGIASTDIVFHGDTLTSTLAEQDDDDDHSLQDNVDQDITDIVSDEMELFSEVSTTTHSEEVVNRDTLGSDDSTEEDVSDEDTSCNVVIMDDVNDTEANVLKSDESQITLNLVEKKLVLVYAYFLLFFQTVYHLSDKGLTVVLSFFKTFITLLGTALSIPKLIDFAKKLPITIYSVRNLVDKKQDYTKYVCCRQCHSIYKYEDSSPQITTCQYIKFPNHPQIHHRKKCGSPLFQTVRLSSGKQKLVPKLIYCYKSVISSLQEMMLREGFKDDCEQWRTRHKNPEAYSDVYDGQIWKDFMIYNDVPFLSIPYNFGFHLNVDWFQPFKHTQHSEGVIYLTILNLPRKKRFLQKNVLLVGVIPGPKEPKKNINSFLAPLVQELLQLWNGVVLKSEYGNVLVRGALLCCGCDIPAARKCCGFLGVNSLHGCSKCLVEFPTATFGEKPNYSNLNLDDWVPRTKEKCLEMGQKYLHAKTKQEQEIIGKTYGIRYSVLLELPYFDISRMCIVDPMHNLLLGTAKHMLDVWKSMDLITHLHFNIIQDRVNLFVAPGDIGRLPSKISSGFSSFTAEQWRNWTMYYSLVSLRDILPHPHYNCWKNFVQVCFLLCRRNITCVQVSEASTSIVTFLNTFLQLYGAKYFTPNLHLHGHLCECIRDYGPVYSFWLFAFERLNGVLGSYNTNCHQISIQLMKRFSDYHSYYPHNWPSEYCNEFKCLKDLVTSDYSKGSLAQSSFEDSNCDLEVVFLPPVMEKGFTQEELLNLQWLVSESEKEVMILYKSSKAIKCSGTVVGSSKSRYSKSSVVLVTDNLQSRRLAEIQFFAKCNVYNSESRSKEETFIVAVKYFLGHECKVWFGHPVEVWCKNVQDELVFLPLSNIKCRVVYIDITWDFGRYFGQQVVRIVTPIEHVLVYSY